MINDCALHPVLRLTVQAFSDYLHLHDFNVYGYSEQNGVLTAYYLARCDCILNNRTLSAGADALSLESSPQKLSLHQSFPQLERPWLSMPD